MPRPIKWARDLHLLRERAKRSRTETWSRQDLQALFGIGRVTAQNLMKTIGEIQSVGGAHFVERSALIQFLDGMIAAPSVEEALRQRTAAAAPPLKPKTLRVSLPEDLRRARMTDLPANISLSRGRLEITAPTAVDMLESLLALAMVMQNDLDRFQAVIEPPPRAASDTALREMLARLREDDRTPVQ